MLTRFLLIGLLQSSISNLGGEAVTIPTNVDSKIPVNRAAVELSSAQPPHYCVGNFSEPALIPDVDLASFGNDSVVALSAVPPASHDA